jgi:hypothetical protein
MSDSVAWARAGTDVYDQLGDLHRGRMCCCCALLAVGCCFVWHWHWHSALRSIAARRRHARARLQNHARLARLDGQASCSARRHVVTFITTSPGTYTLSTSRIGHVGSETDTMKKKHIEIAAIEPCSHLGHDLHCVEPANHTRALPTSSPQKCESLPAHQQPPGPSQTSS